MPTLSGAAGYFAQMARAIAFDQLFTGVIGDLGFDFISALSILTLLLVDILKEKGLTVKTLLGQNLYLRLLIYFVLILVIVLFGAYGPQFHSSAFIYAGF